ncbi:unnamed protein product [Dicrocoelium dendriticum]|nr:unnamed protein product [Dicrocoelium dendriticum]
MPSNGASSQFRDHVGLFLLHLLEEDPRILSLCSVSDLASIYSQEMKCDLDETLRRDFIRTFCSIVCDLMNCQDISRNRRSSRDSKCGSHSAVNRSNTKLLEKTLVPQTTISDTARRILVMSRDTMLTLTNVDTASHDANRQPTNATSSPSNPMESSGSTAREPCKTPLRQEESTYQLKPNCLKSPMSCQPASSPCGNSFQPPVAFPVQDNIAHPRPVVLSVQLPGLRYPLHLPDSSGKLGAVSSGVLSSSTSSTTVRCLSTLPPPEISTTQTTPIRQPSDSPPYITVKRKLSEVVVSIRPAQSRLMEEI